jgi:hypothetical protein
MNKLQPWLKYGVFYALIMIALSLFIIHVYYLGMWIMMAASYVILFFFFFLTAKAYKAQNGGFLSYGLTLKYCFFMGMLGFAILTLFNIINYNVINPEAAQFLTEKTMAGVESTYRAMGMSEDQVILALEAAEKQSGDAYSVSASLLGLVMSSIVVLILAALGALFLKKENKAV